MWHQILFLMGSAVNFLIRGLFLSIQFTLLGIFVFPGVSIPYQSEYE